MAANRPALSLFTGAGGLDLGLEAAGFDVKLCVESDPAARETLAENRPGWRLAKPGNIHRLSARKIREQAKLKRGELVLLSGGPPCQPWSKSSLWAKNGWSRLNDPRAKTIYSYMKVVEDLLPTVLLIENVRGLLWRDDGLGAVRRRLQSINRRQGTRYEIQALTLNAAEFGVPQLRERVFLVAHIDGEEMRPPTPTHGPRGREPYRTAWDAIGHLDHLDWPTDLAPGGKWAALLPSIPEGQNYLWHTPRMGGEPLFGWRTRYWSFLLKLAKNQPSWTIQANPGSASGPFHWRNRRLSIEELAALQTFPQGYTFSGNRHIAHRQVGNAVPCALGELLGLEIRRQLLGEKRVRRKLKLIPAQRDDCPKAHPRRPVSPEYHHLRGVHPDHPGTGLGPGKRAR